ncbi:MAG: NAD(P)-dependent glycerol-3-phosphate dehydrogenase [Alphaproteobacteria bacterium]|nr:NAD(P)-dependent glycerol-3-phosphate dehydrogenase [Alphaproteobacteria bacterium]
MIASLADRSAPKISVLGAGAWGTALANVAARTGADVQLWGRNAAHMTQIKAERENRIYLPGLQLESRITPTSNLVDAAKADLILAVVPAQALRSLCVELKAHIAHAVPIVICAKGIERSTRAFLSDVVKEILPNNPPAILSGPSFAKDVARGLPTAVTLAAADDSLARMIAAHLAIPSFRLYHSTDLRGVEIGGAAKNVLAIACGIAAGRGLGASAGAALVARGFAELNRFAQAHGAKPETLMGLSGLGDLVLTCGSTQSRNYAFGLALGQGTPLAQASGDKLAEGAFTASVLVEMAYAAGIDMPIAQSVDRVLSERLTIGEAIESLLLRPSKSEI